MARATGGRAPGHARGAGHCCVGSNRRRGGHSRGDRSRPEHLPHWRVISRVHSSTRIRCRRDHPGVRWHCRERSRAINDRCPRDWARREGEGGKPNGKGGGRRAAHINAFAINERRRRRANRRSCPIRGAPHVYTLGGGGDPAEAAGGRAKRRAARRRQRTLPITVPPTGSTRDPVHLHRAAGARQGRAGRQGRRACGRARSAGGLQPQNGPCRRAERQSDVCLDGPPDGERRRWRAAGARARAHHDLLGARCGTPRAERRLTVATDG